MNDSQDKTDSSAQQQVQDKQALSHILEGLNPQQQAATIHATGPAMVLAGAGSGKTKVLTTRVAWLLKEQKLNPDAILLLTFTNKAAGEMKERIQVLTGQTIPFSGTFHSVSAKILRKYAPLLGYDPHFTIYDSDDQLALLKELYKAHGYNPKQHNPKGVKARISEAKNELLGPNELAKISRDNYQETVAHLYKLYNQTLQKNHAMDFDDLLINVVTLLQEHESVRAFFQEKFQYILIDEYQDTNTVQYTLTRLLSAPQENVFVVGDFAQSIYAWRGADYRNMLRLKDDFETISEYRLEQNYRSTQTILDAASQVISKNTEHPVLSLWTDKEKTEPITVIESASSDGEAQHVISIARNQLQPHYQYSDMAILYRTNAQSRAFEEACLKAGVPYQIVGGFKFYERKEIKDVLSFVKVLVNPEDTVSYNRAVKLGKRRFKSFEKWKKKYLEQHIQVKETQLLEENAEIHQTATTHELLKKIITASQYTDRYDPKDEDDRSRLENIEELLNVAAQFPTLTSFLENIALVQDNQMADSPIPETKNVLTMMSLHSAKGLEYPVVFMVGMEEGLLPHSRSLLDPSQLEEERRLCYVGITRAKEKLFLSHAQERWQFGSKTYSTQSRFLHDISNELLHTITIGNVAHRNHNTYKKNNQRSAQSNSNTRRLVLDDDMLDGVLTGEFDVDAFLDQ